MKFYKSTGLTSSVHHLAVVLATSAALTSASPAFAFEAIDFFKTLQIEAEKQGNTVKFDNLEAMGADGARASGIEIVNPTKNERMTIGEMTLFGAHVMNDDGFLFEGMQADNVVIYPASVSGERGRATIGSITADQFLVPPSAERNNSLWPMEIGSGRIENVEFDFPGNERVSLTIPSFHIENLKQDTDGGFTIGSARLASGSGSFTTDSGDKGSFQLGEISFSNLARFGQSGFSLDNISMGKLGLDGVNQYDQPIALTFDGLSGANIFNPDYGTEGGFAFTELEMQIDIGSIRFSMAGKELFSMAGASSTAQYNDGTKEYGFDAMLEDLHLNVKDLPLAPKERENLKRFTDLGYDAMTMDISTEGSWNLGTGSLSLSKYTFDAEDMAAFDISLKLDGYTVEMAKKINQISSKMNAEKNPEMRQALSMQMLAEMSALSIRELALRLDDKSLTKRIMNAQAEKSGQSAEDMAAAMPFMAGTLLGQLGAPEFVNSATIAIGAYFSSAMNNEGSLRLVAKPEEPISFAEIMGIAAGVQAGNVKPAEIIDRFNISITGE